VATNWVRVTPYYLSIPDNKGYIMLEMSHKWVPFTYGRIYWSESKDKSTAMEMMTKLDTWSPNKMAVAQTKMMVGGYYVVKYDLNGSAIGGTAFALAVVVAAAFYARKRFGCKCFSSGRKSAASVEGAQQKQGLLPSGQTSDAPAAAAPTTTSV